MSRPVACCVYDGRLVVVCVDGTIWRYSDTYVGLEGEELEAAHWQLMPPIPDTGAQLAVERG